MRSAYIWVGAMAFAMILGGFITAEYIKATWTQEVITHGGQVMESEHYKLVVSTSLGQLIKRSAPHPAVGWFTTTVREILSAVDKILDAQSVIRLAVMLILLALLADSIRPKPLHVPVGQK